MVPFRQPNSITGAWFSIPCSPVYRIAIISLLQNPRRKRTYHKLHIPLFTPFQIRIRIILQYQRQYRLQPQRLHKLEIPSFGETTSINARRDDTKVLWGDKWIFGRWRRLWECIEGCGRGVWVRNCAGWCRGGRMGIEDILEEGWNLYRCIRCGIGWEDKCTGGGEREVWPGGYWPCFRTCTGRRDLCSGVV
jgi:hypothetical protein